MSFLVVAISRSGLCHFLPKHGIQVGRLHTMGVHISFSINITASEVLLPPKWPLVFLSSWCTKLGAPKWAKKSVRYREIYRRDTISRYQSQKFGMWIQLTSRYIVSCDIAWYGTWYPDIYRETMSHRITSKHQANTNSTKTHHLVAAFSFFFSALSLPSSSLVLRLAFLVVLLLSIRWTHHRTDRTASKQQRCPLRTRPAAWACTFVFVSFFIFFSFIFFPCLFSFLIPGINTKAFFGNFTTVKLPR